MQSSYTCMDSAQAPFGSPMPVSPISWELDPDGLGPLGPLGPPSRSNTFGRRPVPDSPRPNNSCEEGDDQFPQETFDLDSLPGRSFFSIGTLFTNHRNSLPQSISSPSTAGGSDRKHSGASTSSLLWWGGDRRKSSVRSISNARNNNSSDASSLSDGDLLMRTAPERVTDVRGRHLSADQIREMEAEAARRQRSCSPVLESEDVMVGDVDGGGESAYYTHRSSARREIEKAKKRMRQRRAREIIDVTMAPFDGCAEA